MKCSPEVGGEFTRKNLTVASANSGVIGAPGAGKKKIYRVSCSN
jgi:hypothetical protein